MEAIIAIIGVILLALFGGKYWGDSSRRAKEEAKEKQRVIDTNEALNKVRRSPDADSARERMRKRSKP